MRNLKPLVSHTKSFIIWDNKRFSLSRYKVDKFRIFRIWTFELQGGEYGIKILVDWKQSKEFQTLHLNAKISPNVE